jgi:hypothetical protein
MGPSLVIGCSTIVEAHDKQFILEAIASRYPEAAERAEWSGDGIALLNTESQDLGLFEPTSNPEEAFGHYFFLSRGRKALITAKQMLDYVFARTDINTVYGLTPVEHKAALWFNNKLGFTTLNSSVEIGGELFRFVVLNKLSWEMLNE